MLTIKLEREVTGQGCAVVRKGSRRAPDKNVVTLRIDRGGKWVEVELNKMEAETLANALKAAVR